MADPNALGAAVTAPSSTGGGVTINLGGSGGGGGSSSAGSGASGPADPGASLLGTLGAGYSVYNAMSQNNAQSNMFNAIRQPSVNAGTNYLNNATSGTLPPAQSAQYNTQANQAATLANQASPYLNAANQGLQQYQAGQLPAWQQQQLDNQTAAAIAQARASMGANVDSSTMAMIESQIRSQASITQGQLLQQNLQTSETLYNLGATTQNESFALMNAANQSVITNLQQDFSNAMAAFTQGDSATANMINTQLQNDQRLSSALDKLIKGLSSSGAITSLSGSNGSVIGALKNLMGMGDGTPSYVTSGQYQTDVSQYLASNPLQGTSTMAPADYVASLGPTDYGTVDSVTYDSSGG